MLKTKNDKKRFFDKVNKNGKDACWVWIASKFSGGYGAFTFGRNNVKYAHRVSYTYFKGEIPSKHVVRHTCNNASCVNPQHLVLSSSKLIKQGKANSPTAGKNHYNAKKQKFKVWNNRTGEVYEFYYQFEAADALNVSSGTINRILKKKNSRTTTGYQAEYIIDDV